MRISVGSGSSLAVSDETNGRLQATPAYYQTAGSQDVQLDSADKLIATRIIPRTDFELQTLSRYVNAVMSEGDGTLQIWSDGTAPEPNGELYNESETRCHANMTGASSPSPLVVTATSYSSTYYPYLAFDGTSSYWYSGDDPSVTQQNVAIDLGAGNETIVNKIGIQNGTNTARTPNTFKVWGSSLTSPDADSDGDWVELHSVSGEPNHAGAYTTKWFTFFNATPYRHYRFSCTLANSIALELAEILFVSPDVLPAPGTLIQSLGTLSSGSAAGWTRLEVTSENRYQFQRGRAVWIVEKGEASKDYSVSKRRVNTTNGSMFPDEMGVSKESSDGGTTWTVSLQDGRRALWNIVLNSAPGHVPQLMCARFNGKWTCIDGTLRAIPEEGVFMDCSSLDAVEDGDTPYDVFIYYDATEQKLKLHSDNCAGVSITDGIEHLTGNEAYRWIGQIAPQELQSGVQGPVDVPDMRLVANAFNVSEFVIGKWNPYSSNTSYSVPAGRIKKWNDGDHFRVAFLACRPVCLKVRAMVPTGAFAHHVILGVDQSAAVDYRNAWCAGSDSEAVWQGIVAPGYHVVWPLSYNQTSSSQWMRLFYEGAAVSASNAAIQGTLGGV